MRTGQKHSDASRVRMSISRKGTPAHNKGQQGTICIRGHLKTKLGNIGPGTCRICVKILHEKYREMPHLVNSRRDSAWKARGIKTYDNSFFTTVDYDRLYQIQQGSCKICKTHQSELKRVFDVDHSHTTGIVRGLLCHGCNMKVGSFESPLAAEIRKYLGDNNNG